MRTLPFLCVLITLLSSAMQAQIHEITQLIITDVSYDGAKIRGHINGEGISERGVCFSLKKNQKEANTHVSIECKPFGGFTSEIEDLEPNTTYYIKSYAQIKDKKYYGKERKFTTSHLKVPIAKTNSVSKINNTCASVLGIAIGEGILECGICYSREAGQQDPENWISGKYESSIVYRFLVEDLEPETSYYFRFYASNKAGKSFGQEISLTTPAQPKPSQQ